MNRFSLPFCLAPRLSVVVYVELIVHENLEVMSVGEALARAESGQQQGLPLQILDDQISEPWRYLFQTREHMTIESRACCGSRQ